MEETIKYLLALIIGTLISPLWSKFLNKDKSKLESDKLRSDECLNTLALFKDSLKEMERKNTELKAKVDELQDKNDRTISHFNKKIAELQEINTYQTQKIIELDKEVKKCADAKKPKPKKKPVRKAVI
jgi:TolA-binding protein